LLNVKFEKSLVRVPFRILTEDEEKLLSKNDKAISPCRVNLSTRKARPQGVRASHARGQASGLSDIDVAKRSDDARRVNQWSRFTGTIHKIVVGVGPVGEAFDPPLEWHNRG
jgi:hypothetical protein